MGIIETTLYRDKGEIKLKLDTFRHIYTANGVPVPSVTTALKIIDKPALVNWAAGCAVDYCASSIEPGKSYDELELLTVWDNARKSHWQKKKDAGDLGSIVHKWVENYINGENPGMPVNQKLQDSVNNFLDWVKRHNVKFLLSEQQVYSKKYNYTGTLDFICQIDGKLYLGDLKTSSGIWPEYFIQTSAYRAAREEEYPEEVFAGQLIVRVGKDGEFEFAMIDDYAWYRKMFVAFIAALKLSESMEDMKNFTPGGE
jgi:hypothetical protein